jgi:hypothetical protein
MIIRVYEYGLLDPTFVPLVGTSNKGSSTPYESRRSDREAAQRPHIAQLVAIHRRHARRSSSFRARSIAASPVRSGSASGGRRRHGAHRCSTTGTKSMRAALTIGVQGGHDV